jgi:hypothetical protein
MDDWELAFRAKSRRRAARLRHQRTLRWSLTAAAGFAILAAALLGIAALN